MARIRIHCPHCATTALLRPEQVLLVPHPGGATYLFTCPICERVSDGATGPEHVLLLVAAGVRPAITGFAHRERS
jgi:hypothetical protein